MVKNNYIISQNKRWREFWEYVATHHCIHDHGINRLNDPEFDLNKHFNDIKKKNKFYEIFSDIIQMFQ